MLETGKVLRVGGVKEKEISIRLVAATHRDLDEEVKTKRFRQDLFFRLSASMVHLPPLRERTREISVLGRRFLAQSCAQSGRAPLSLSAATLVAMGRYAWPGNVRELKNAMEYVTATIAGEVVEPADLPERISGKARVAVPVVPAAGPRPFRPLLEEIAELERTRMREALEAAKGVQKHAAELIGMPRRTFVYKMREHQLGSDVGKK